MASYCIAGFKPETGNQFLTYAAPATRNAMVDYIRRRNPTFEAKNLGSIDRLDDVLKDENRVRHEFVADSTIKNPEQSYIAKETHVEIHTDLQRIDRRERTYLWYRFGFEDDMEHPLNETARHFHLSVIRIFDQRWQPASALALTLPDICGGIAFPEIVKKYRDRRAINRNWETTYKMGGHLCSSLLKEDHCRC